MIWFVKENVIILKSKCQIMTSYKSRCLNLYGRDNTWCLILNGRDNTWCLNLNARDNTRLLIEGFGKFSHAQYHSNDAPVILWKHLIFQKIYGRESKIKFFYSHWTNIWYKKWTYCIEIWWCKIQIIWSSMSM